MRIPFEGRGRRRDEAIRLMRALWSGERDFEEEFWSFHNATSKPLPVAAGAPAPAHCHSSGGEEKPVVMVVCSWARDVEEGESSKTSRRVRRGGQAAGDTPADATASR